MFHLLLLQARVTNIGPISKTCAFMPFALKRIVTADLRDSM